MILTIIILLARIYIYFFSFELKKTRNLKRTNIKIELIIFIIFGVIFSILYRILIIILRNDEVSLTVFLSKIFLLFNCCSLLNFFFLIYLFFCFRNLIILIFKKSFLVIHYYILSKIHNNYNKNCYNYYEFFFYDLKITNYLRLKPYLFYIFKFLFFFIFLIILFFEILFNDFVLKYSILLLPYLALYQFFFICLSFTIFRMVKDLDFLLCKVFYKKTFTFEETKISYLYLNKLFL